MWLEQDGLFPQGSDLLPLDVGPGKVFEQVNSAPRFVGNGGKDLYHDHHTPTASNGSAADTVETWGAASDCPVAISPFAAIQTPNAEWVAPQRQGSSISDSDNELDLDGEDCIEGQCTIRAC